MTVFYHTACLLSLVVTVLCVRGTEAGPPAAGACSTLSVRQEWRTLSDVEKRGWIEGVTCLASLDHERLSYTAQGAIVSGVHSLYDDFGFAHATMDSEIHMNAYFLPWHRWFLYLFDKNLKSTCGYRGPTPYWDWSLDASDLIGSSMWDPDPLVGLGGTGDCSSSPTSDCHVPTGAFSPAHSTFSLSYPIPHALRRNFTLITGWFAHERPANATLNLENVRNATMHTTGDFFRFQHAMTQMHNHVHNFVGGDMAGTCPREIPEDECNASFTPNEPLFWLHHAQLDRLWSNWQRSHPDNFYSFSGVPVNTTRPDDPRYDANASATHEMLFDRLSLPLTVSDVFDTTAWPLCYQYVDVSIEEKLS